MEDTKIVDLYLARNEAAIRETDEKYGKRLFLLSKNITSDGEDAKECVSDTYLDAWNRIPPHEPRSYLFAFLARIARAASIDRCRKNTRQKRAAHIEELSRELEECLAAPDDIACRIDDRYFAETLNAFLGSLPETERNVFLRRYWYADGIEAVAMRFGFGKGKVKSMLFRTRGKLKDDLAERGILL